MGAEMEKDDFLVLVAQVRRLTEAHLRLMAHHSN